MSLSYHKRQGMSTAWIILVTGLSVVIVILLLLIFLGKDKEPPLAANIAEPVLVEEIPKQIGVVAGVDNVLDVETEPLEELELVEPLTFQGEILAGLTSPILDFNESDYLAAIDSDKLVILYFFANWGPVCKVELTDAVYPTFESIIDDNTVAFRVNFNDNQTDSFEKQLAEDYAINYQHTKVFIKDGEELIKTSEAWTKEFFLKEIQRFAVTKELSL